MRVRDQETELDAAWALSPQRAAFRRISLISFGSGLVLALISMGVFVFNETTYSKGIIWVVVAYISLFAPLLVMAYQKAEKRRQFEVEQSLSRLAEEGADQDSVELIALWKANKSQLGHYHKIVMNYAESSKRSTQWYLIGGFIFVLSAGVMTLFATRTETAIGTTVIAAAAAALTGFVAKAVLRNTATASSELQMFFNHPLEVERALAAERLVDEFETKERRDEARLLIIQALTRERPQLKAAASDFVASSGTETPPSEPEKP